MKILIFGVIGFLVPLWIGYAAIVFYKLDLSYKSSYGFPLCITFALILIVGVISGIEFGRLGKKTKIILNSRGSLSPWNRH